MDGNSELTAEPKLINPLDIKPNKAEETNDVLGNIVALGYTKYEPILGPAPEVDSSLLEDLEPPKSILLIALKSAFGIVIGLSVFSFLFFESQLSSKFDLLTTALGIPNVSKDLAANNEEITSLQTGLDIYRYQEIKGELDRMSFYGDSFIQNYENTISQTALAEEKTNAKDEILKLKKQIFTSYLVLRDFYNLDFTAPLIDTKYVEQSSLDTMFTERVKANFTSKAATLANSTDTAAKNEYKNNLHTAQIVGNNDLKTLILTSDPAAMSDKDLYNFLKKVNSLVVNELSTIQGIKEKRIKWSDVMNEIERRTIDVDSHYSENFYNQIGGIRYTSYDLDTANRQISIIGETKRFDSTNFTMIADLIDALNRSSLFESGEMRSFSKSGSVENGFTATLKLTLDLQNPDQLKTEESTDIQNLPDLTQK